MKMNHVERFRAVMNFQPVDRLPVWEWAMWWDKSIARWHNEGLPSELKHSQVFEIAQYFGLDPYQQFWFSTTQATIAATQHHTEGGVGSLGDYLRILPNLFPDHSPSIAGMLPWAARQARGEAVVWVTLEGFFWFPRTLMDFEGLSYAYYDEPELVHRINQDLLDFNLRLLEQLVYHKVVAEKGKPGVFLRFPCNVDPVGYSGFKGRSYQGQGAAVVSAVRAILRVIAPWYWF